MMFSKLLILASLFAFAGFQQRKQIKNSLQDTSVFDFVIGLLSGFDKFFPIVWHKLEMLNLTDPINLNQNKQKIQEIINDSSYIFKNFENLNLERKDFNQYRDLDELTSTVNQAMLDLQQRRVEQNQLKRERVVQNYKEIDPGDSTKIYEDDELVVYRVNSKKGASDLAAHDTTWCITRPNQMYYEQYTASDQIFYFVINKELPINNALQKAAIRVSRGQNEIHVHYTNKINDGDYRDPKEVPGYQKFISTIIGDARQQPESLVVKVRAGRGTQEDKQRLWDSYHSASIREKWGLLEIINDSNLRHDFTELMNDRTFTLDDVNKLDLKKLDSATLEKIADDVHDDDLYRKLIKFRYHNVNWKIAQHTSDPKLLTQLSFDDEAKYAVSFNENSPQEVLRNLFKQDDNIIVMNIAKNSSTPIDILNNIFFNCSGYENEDKILERLARNSNSPRDLLDKIYNSDFGQDLMYVLIQNKNASKHILYKVFENIKDTDNLIYIDYIIEHKNCDTVLLDRIFQYVKNDDSAMVNAIKYNLIMNPKTSKYTLVKAYRSLIESDANFDRDLLKHYVLNHPNGRKSLP